MSKDEQDKRICDYWEDSATESMYDKYLAELEAEMLSRYITSDDTVLDLGCGDGSGSQMYRDRIQYYVGLDRSKMMLNRFIKHHCMLIRGDLRTIPISRALKSRFSIVVTQRALINLPDVNTQQQVIRELPELLSTDGKLLLCEAFKEGVDRLNELRRHLGCKPIGPKWHNIHLERSLTAQVLGDHMELIAEEDLSWYYVLTRVVHQTLVGDTFPKWNSPINRIAYQIARSGKAPHLSGYSIIALQVWQRLS